jgi:hypothetical protein
MVHKAIAHKNLRHKAKYTVLSFKEAVRLLSPAKSSKIGLGALRDQRNTGIFLHTILSLIKKMDDLITL